MEECRRGVWCGNRGGFETERDRIRRCCFSVFISDLLRLLLLQLSLLAPLLSVKLMFSRKKYFRSVRQLFV